MPHKVKGSTKLSSQDLLEIRLSERRSPIPYNSFEAGCTVRMSVSSTKNFDSDLDQLLEVAEEGLDRARALLEARLKQDQKDGLV